MEMYFYSESSIEDSAYVTIIKYYLLDFKLLGIICFYLFILFILFLSVFSFREFVFLFFNSFYFDF